VTWIAGPGARALLVTAVFLAIGCHREETSLLIEVVPGAVDVAALEDVAIRVTGPGLQGGQRTAWAPLRGAAARPFPLSLLIRGTAGQDGPFAITAEAHIAGAVRASAAAGEPVALQPGRMVRFQLTLEPVGGPPPPDAAGDDAATIGHPPLDAAADRAAVGQPPPDAGRPDGTVRPDVAPPLGCEDCDQACLDHRAPAGVCTPVPDGTACHGMSGMACHGCRCGS
jgi:hypothetical protein